MFPNVRRNGALLSIGNLSISNLLASMLFTDLENVISGVAFET